MNNGQLNSTQELLAAAKKSILFTTTRPDIVMEKGQGLFLWDTEGKEYLDFVGGWAVTSLGHSPAAIAQALDKQSRVLVNASPSFLNKPMIEYAKMLTDYSCLDRVFFASSGAEANEGAIKLARKYGSTRLGGAYEIITTINSFHGRTLATMSATGKQKWKPLFEPKVPGFIHVPLNDFAALQAAVTDKTCAIMLEPVQGEGGVFELEQDYIRKVRALCTEKKILLIFDEVQTGLARTGKLFAYEHYGVEPDVMTLAKGIGGGFPLAALLAKEQFNVFEIGDQGGTYSGQPLAMAVGLAVMNEVLEKKLADNAAKQGEYLQQQLRQIASRFGLTNIRGRGLLIAFDLPTDKGSEVVGACLEKGLLLNSPQPSMIRLMPPLIVTAEDTDAMMAILSSALADVLP
jgi:acetylornithine/N-succinyldiaminopimelate aminotransferase